jgi:tetratricopeptide (TPR) repeat protein
MSGYLCSLSWMALSRTALILCLSASAVSARAAESVQTLRYGVTLYHFYQQEYFDALTELMVAQELEQLGVHAQGAELLRGGISLSYGMDLEASRVFTRLLSDEGSPEVRDRAWYYLAKVAWHRGDLLRTGQALQQLGTMQGSVMGEEVNYLRSALALQQGDVEGARLYIDRLGEQSSWLPYHYYNLGALLASQGSWQEAAGSFRRVDQPWIDGEELKSLRDKSYTASGFALMAAAEPAQASMDFTRVRLDSPMADRALLGYGWAEMEVQNTQIALSAWAELAQKPAISIPVRESLLAIPAAYEQSGREAVALTHYQAAALVFETELERVQAAIEVFEQGDMLALLNLKTEAADEWLFGGDILPVNPQAPFLQHLISGHEFQSAMKELRDLHRVYLRLSEATRRLEVLVYVDADQQADWEKVIEGNSKQLLLERFGELTEKLAALQSRLAGAEQAADGRALASATQLELWARLERATRISTVVDASPKQQQQLALYRGLLIWDDSENYVPAFWQASRDMRQLRQLLQQSKDGIAEIDQAIAGHTESSALPRIQGLVERAGTQKARVEIALQDSDRELRRVAVNELQGQSLELRRALGQSKLAIARLYDKGSMGALQ